MTSPNAPAVRTTTALVISNEVIAKYPVLAEETRTDLAELIRENFADGEAMSIKDLTMVKLPSGKSAPMYAVTSDGETRGEATIEAVIAGWQDRRNWWESDEVTNVRPDCFSRDNVVGIGRYGPGSEGNPTGACATCPMSQWNEVNGKRIAPPCKPQAAILLMVEGEFFPWLLQAPRTSLKGFKAYRAGLFKKLKGVAQVVTVLSMEKIKGEGVPDYFTVKFTMGEDLGKAAKKAMIEVGATFLPILNNTAAADAASAAGSVADPTRPAPQAVDEDGGYGVEIPEDEPPADDINYVEDPEEENAPA